MRSKLLSAFLGLCVLGFMAPAADASWLSQALNKLREPVYPGQYVPPSGYVDLGVPSGIFQPGPYYPPGPYSQVPVEPRPYQAPPVPSFIPNISGTWYMNGNPYLPCQIIQWRKDGSAEFINEHGSRTWGIVNGDHVWIPEWSDGSSRGLSGWIQGNRIVWPTGTFWSR